MSYHEQVARAMKATYAVGSHNAYETILGALQRRFPDEQELRQYVAILELLMVDSGSCPPDWRLIDEGERDH